MRVARVCCLLATVGTGCSLDAFACLSNDQCAQGGVAGTCQPDGNCSFPDARCESGQRYGQYSSGGIAGQCVPAEGAGSSGGASDSGASTTATSMTSTSTSTSTTSTSSSTTGVGPTAGDSDGGSSGGPATLCEQYCAAKAACSIAFPNCLQDCIDITGVAAGTDAQCSGSLDAVVECRLALTCEELQTAIASGGLVGCTEQTTALAQTCITETCDGYCTLAEQCQAGGGGPNGDCGLSCAVQSVLAPLDAGGAMCLFAFDDALDCLGNLMDCTEFNDAVNGQGPCSEELGLVSMVCPMGA